MATRRKNEMWVSNNRVLVGGNKKVTGRNPNFDTEETKLLISLWGDPKLQKTLITTHKKYAVIVKLAEKMREYGYHRSPEEINTRIKNLKCFYNRIKKDMELGIGTEPTWKHFHAMDDIMTRPIFSVRPNEIPKPSLRYRLEEERQEREDREKEATSRGRIRSKELDESDDEDGDSFTQELLEDEMEAASETDQEDRRQPRKRSIGKEEQVIQLKKPKQEIVAEDELQLRTEIEADSDVEETPLLIPKDEPIDIDDDDDIVVESTTVPIKIEDNNDDSRDIFPKLSAYLQLTSNTTITTNTTTTGKNKTVTNVVSTNASKSSGEPSTSISTPTTTSTSTTSTIKLPQSSIVIANQQSQSTGKISLVPTNILLKPQQQSIQLRPQTQHRILYTNSTQSNQGIVQPTPGQPMKVLLVNTLQKSPGSAVCPPGGTVNSETSVKLTATTTAKSNATTSNGIIHTVTTAVPATTSAVNDANQKTTISSSYKSMLAQLVQIQTENLEVSRKRLELERQRLDFEKSIAERIINALPHIFQAPNNTNNPQIIVPKAERQT